jgi:hypothetical protein
MVPPWPFVASRARWWEHPVRPNPKVARSSGFALKDLTTFPWHATYEMHRDMRTWVENDLATGSRDRDGRTYASVDSWTTTEASIDEGQITDRTSATLSPIAGGLGKSLPKGGAATLMWPRSSSMMQGRVEQSVKSLVVLASKLARIATSLISLWNLPSKGGTSKMILLQKTWA